MFKKFLCTAICLMVLSGLSVVNGADIEAILDDSTSSTGFSIKDGNGTTIFRMLGDGNLGIGTMASKAKLHILPSGNENGLFVDGNSTNDIAWFSSTDLQFVTLDSNGENPSEKMIIKDNGNIGFGNGSPEDRVHISQGGLLLDNGQTLKMKDNIGTNRNVFFVNSENKVFISNKALKDVSIRTAFGISLFLDAQGNAGFGTLAPDRKLSVNGDASKVGGGSWATFSDVRLKNIKATYDAGLKEVLQLQPVRYKYKSGNPLNIPNGG